MAQVKYPFKSPFIRFLFGCIDFGLSSTLGVAIPKGGKAPSPRRLLLCNSAHLGDVILSTSLLPVLKKALPDTQIGFLAGSWAKECVAGHPLIDFVHSADHWKTNRSPLSLPQKIAHYRRTKPVNELRRIQYDAAIDLCFHFPNFAPLLYQAGIPMRIGFTSAGFGPLLTHPVTWPNQNRSVVHDFLSLCEPLFPTEPFRQFLAPHLTSSPLVLGEKYILIHMGTGEPRREWPVESWRELVHLLHSDGHTLVFTGRGKREDDRIRQAAGDLPRTLNLCDRLSWGEFVAAVRQASFLIGLESSAGHVASATGTRSLLLYTDPSERWRPFSPLCRTALLPIFPKEVYTQLYEFY